jgi:hypothetical protein
MLQVRFSLALLLAGGTLLSSCGSQNTDVHTSTPSSMLGTDSAATTVGGTPPVPVDTTATGVGQP